MTSSRNFLVLIDVKPLKQGCSAATTGAEGLPVRCSCELDIPCCPGKYGALVLSAGIRAMGKSTKGSRDLYYRSAKQEGWRARSAFKLLNLNKSLGGSLFRGVKRAVDLCAAPGSWSQVLSQQIYLPNQNDPEIKLVAVDFQFMVPIPGVIQFQGDITEVSTAEKILHEFKGEKADLVICDGAPDVTGLHELDVYRHHDIVVAALGITTAILKEGGTMVMKVFKKKEDAMLGEQIAVSFREVRFLKPEGSRNSSLEHFAVGLSHFCPADYQPRLLLDYFGCKKMDPFRNSVIPFVIYGETLNSRKCGKDDNNIPSADQDFALPSKFSNLSLQHDAEERNESDEKIRFTETNQTDPSRAALNGSLPVSSKASQKFVWQSDLPTLGEILHSMDL